MLEESDADLAVVGLVKEPGESLSLWFVPRLGEGTLTRGDEPYELAQATLGPDNAGSNQWEIRRLAPVTV